MPRIEISVRRTERVADLARQVRRITEIPLSEIAAAASGQLPLFRGDLLGRDSTDVQEKVLALMQRLSDGDFGFWIELDGSPTDRATIENIIGSSRKTAHEQTLQLFLEPDDSGFGERFAIQAELLLGPRWPLWIMVAVLVLAVAVLLVVRWSAS